MLVGSGEELRWRTISTRARLAARCGQLALLNALIKLGVPLLTRCLVDAVKGANGANGRGRYACWNQLVRLHTAEEMWQVVGDHTGYRLGGRRLAKDSWMWHSLASHRDALWIGGALAQRYAAAASTGSSGSSSSRSGVGLAVRAQMLLRAADVTAASSASSSVVRDGPGVPPPIVVSLFNHPLFERRVIQYVLQFAGLTPTFILKRQRSADVATKPPQLLLKRS